MPGHRDAQFGNRWARVSLLLAHFYKVSQ